MDRPARRRAGGGGDGPLSHRRRPDRHRGRSLKRDRHRDRDRRDRAGDRFRAWRDPRRRPHVGGRDGGPQARGLLLMDDQRELLRLATAGSVDDGKSTLIGRLLLDTGSLLADHLDDVSSNGGQPDLAAVTDGLRAEREQGITIDVAYRFFSTERRSFVLADTPGHERYTRNMFTGASTADVAVVLIDARAGVMTQTRRHTHIASLLGVEHVVMCVNKMDLVGWDPARFAEIVQEVHDLTRRLRIEDLLVVPISALHGDNIAF